MGTFTEACGINPKNPRAYQGRVKLENPSKYMGVYDSEKGLIYRSKLELTYTKKLDLNPAIKAWIYEPDFVKISYFNHILGKMQNYHIDYYVEMLHAGELKKYIVEVKSFSGTVYPKRENYKSEKTYKKAIADNTIIEAKKRAAVQWCAGKDLKFMFVTEKTLYNNGRY